ncbi:MAG: MFS transporter, partial [Caulobacteraceae bacterium]
IMGALQSKADFLAWGWRLPFLLSGILVAIGWWVRARVEESPAFVAIAQGQKRSPAPGIEVLRTRLGGIAIGAGLRFGENVSFYILTALSLTYATEVAGLSRASALNAVLAGAAAECVTLPLFSALSDRIGRRPVYAAGAIGMAAWAFAFFPLATRGDGTGAMLAVVVGLVLHGAMYGPQAAFISELFPTRLRYSGASIAYQLTSIFAGSLAPIVALALLHATGSTIPISIYVAATCAVSAVSALIARETGGASLAAIDALTPERSISTKPREG